MKKNMQNLRSKRNIIIAISASLLLIVFEIINNKFILNEKF